MSSAAILLASLRIKGFAILISYTAVIWKKIATYSNRLQLMATFLSWCMDSGNSLTAVYGCKVLQIVNIWQIPIKYTM